MLRLDQMEALYYKLQLQLYDIQAEVLQCEELLLTAQLQSLRRQMTGGRACLAMFEPRAHLQLHLGAAVHANLFTMGLSWCPSRTSGRGGVLRCL